MHNLCLFIYSNYLIQESINTLQLYVKEIRMRRLKKDHRFGFIHKMLKINIQGQHSIVMRGFYKQADLKLDHLKVAPESIRQKTHSRVSSIFGFVIS